MNRPGDGLEAAPDRFRRRPDNLPFDIPPENRPGKLEAKEKPDCVHEIVTTHSTTSFTMSGHPMQTAQPLDADQTKASLYLICE
jgi:hypothetical protein